MSAIVTMSSTVGDLTNGQTYRVRSKTAERLVANSQATKSALKKITTGSDNAGKFNA